MSLIAQLVIDLSDLKDDYLAGTISEADFYRLRNARKGQFDEDEKEQWEQQTEEVREFFRECRATGKVRKGR